MWAELPEDMVESISKKLTNYADYVRYRCVCRRWRLATPKAPLHLPTQLPWLMISHQSFFDFSTNKIYDLNLAPCSSRGSWIYGSSHGWLVIIDKFSYEVRLLNPITLATISLPRLVPSTELIKVVKVVLSSSPSISDDFTAFALVEFNKFAVCRKGYDSWVVLNWGINCYGMDAIYKNGSFFVVGTNGMIAVFDVDRRKISHIETSQCERSHIERYGIRSEISPFGLTGMRGVQMGDRGNGIPFVNNDCNLVFFKENMLLVIRIFMCNRNTIKTVGFKIYKMNWNVGKWEQIHSLGEHSLFIGIKSSTLCCSVADFVGCRPNCIYFTDCAYECAYGAYFCIYSLSNESIDTLPGNPHRSYSDSVWVEPNPN